MKIYAMSDLHLTYNSYGSMSKFGSVWDGHPEVIIDRWNSVVKKGDLVLVPGDISWAKTLDEAKRDLHFLDKLNGTKIIGRGNHDRWWKGIKRLRSFLNTTSIIPLRNDCIRIGDVGIIGTKGYSFETRALTDDYMSSKGFLAEYNRLQMSVDDAVKDQPKYVIGMIHFPPFRKLDGGLTEFTELFEWAESTECVYGHVHTAEHQMKAYQGKLHSVRYHLVSADYLHFFPKLIVDLP